MRLPLTAEGKVDEAQVEAMVKYAMDHGVNYFDTAYPYHDGESERIIGRILSQYPRESYYLADKFPVIRFLMITLQSVFLKNS